MGNLALCWFQARVASKLSEKKGKVTMKYCLNIYFVFISMEKRLEPFSSMKLEIYMQFLNKSETWAFKSELAFKQCCRVLVEAEPSCVWLRAKP